MEFKLKSEYNFHLKKHNVINQNDLNNDNIIKNQHNFNLVVNNIQNIQKEKTYLNFFENLNYRQFYNFNLQNYMNNVANNINENNVIENNNYMNFNEFYGVNNNLKYDFNFNYNVNMKKFNNLIITKEINYNICCI